MSQGVVSNDMKDSSMRSQALLVTLGPDKSLNLAFFKCGYEGNQLFVEPAIVAICFVQRCDLAVRLENDPLHGLSAALPQRFVFEEAGLKQRRQ